MLYLIGFNFLVRIIILYKDMKVAGLAMRLSGLLVKRLPYIQATKANKIAITTAGVGFGYAYLMSTNKIFAEELITVETANDLK